MSQARIDALEANEDSARILREALADRRNLKGAFIKASRVLVEAQATVDAIQDKAVAVEAVIESASAKISEAHNVE